MGRTVDWKYRNMLRWSTHREPLPTKIEVYRHILSVYYYHKRRQVSKEMALAWAEEISAAIDGRPSGLEQRVD